MLRAGPAKPRTPHRPVPEKPNASTINERGSSTIDEPRAYSPSGYC